jgi:hypothetical protein
MKYLLHKKFICVKSSFFFLADLRGFYLLPSAYLQSASICVKQSFLFSLIYADLCCAHLRETIFSFLADLRGFYLRLSAFFNLHLSA